MKKQDKVNLVLAGAGVLVALYAFMPKGEQGPGSSGGLGAGLGGLPSVPGGGGADSPTVNIDFPALPELRLMDIPTKKEEEAKKQGAQWAGMTYDPSAFKYSPENPSPLFTSGIVTNPFTQAETVEELKSAIGTREDLFALSKKEQKQNEPAPWLTPFLNPAYDWAVSMGYGSRSGYKTTQQMRSEGSKSGSSGSGETTRYASIAPTKKEMSTTRTGGSSGGGGGGYYSTGYTTGPSDPGYYSSVMNSISSGITRGL